MANLLMHINVPVKVIKRRKWYLASCPVFDVHSQGDTEKEARKNLIEALTAFFFTCLDTGTFVEVLKQCGFEPDANIPFTNKECKKLSSDFVDVPLPLSYSSRKSGSYGCHA